MSNFTETTRRIFEEYTELTENPSDDLVFDFDQEFYAKYNLPALHLLDGFYQGDATHEEITKIKDNLVSYENVAEEGEEPEYEYDFDVLDNKYVEELEKYFLKYKQDNWKELFEERIKEFLEENYPKEGRNTGNDYSVWLDIENGEVFEMIQVSQNWAFKEGRNRVEITKTPSYEDYYYTVRDLVGANGDTVIAENLNVKLPEDWTEFSFEEKIEWVEGNAEDGIKAYNENAREEAIETIMNNLDSCKEDF